jgi:hypothetical protein
LAKILALGDCITLGVQHLKGDSYPERFAKVLDVFYYSDNTVRKIFRKIVKKYKKTVKKIGLNGFLGVLNVVSLEVYKNNIMTLIEQLNETGYEIITQKILSVYNKLEVSSSKIL